MGVAPKPTTPAQVAVIEQLAEAAEGVATEREAAAVMGALGHTPRLSESGIAPDVLARLLPDAEVVVLPRLSRVNGGPAYRAAKRAFDVAACGAALLVLALPMLAIAAAVRLESPGPAIYAQRRVGKGGRAFELYKFRSMRADAEVRGARWAEDGDPRVTRVGRFLRTSRLDELPQFWNVVKGDMSLIGPRPERPAFCEEFEKRIVGWGQRTAVRPGITGLAQVSGGYELLPREKALYDIEYIETRCLALDWQIILRTFKTMISGDGAR